jgi:SAM-dependent methyltransferase
VSCAPGAQAAVHDDWETHWERFDEAAARNPAQAYRRWLVGRLLERHGPPRRILDVGSGTGDFAADALARWPGAEVLGLEYSAAGVRTAARKAPGARFEQADLMAAGVAPSAPQDAGWATHAVCSEVLEHVDDPARLLAAARAWMAPGCRLVVTVPGGPMSAFDRHIGHRRHFSARDLREVLAAAGFRTVVAAGAGFPFFNLYRGVVIARGQRLVDDVSAQESGTAESLLARTVMGAFAPLLRATLPRTPLGWQTYAVAYAPSF